MRHSKHNSKFTSYFWHPFSLSSQLKTMETHVGHLLGEVNARERSATSRSPNPSSPPKKPLPRGPPTAAALMASSSGPIRSSFCEQGHAWSTCTVVTDVNARKEALRKSGRCYVCLRKGHISWDCRSMGCCNKCQNVQVGLQQETTLSDPVCYTDSRVALHWIRGCNQEWRQFVKNQVTSMLQSHLSVGDTAPGRKILLTYLPEEWPLQSWLSGPDWLCTSQDLPGKEMDNDAEVPEECHQEMKSKKAAHSLVVAQSHHPRIGQLMSCETFSSLHRLLQVTAIVLNFVHLLRLKVRKSSDCTHSPSKWDWPSQTVLPQRRSISAAARQQVSCMLMNFGCGGAVAGCLTQIFPRQLKRYFLKRITHWWH